MLIVDESRIILRSLWRRPAVSLAILCSIALGIGVSTAVFTLIRAVLLHPISARQPKQLVAIYFVSQQTQYGSGSLTARDAIEAHARSLSSVVATYSVPVEYNRNDGPRDVRASFVTGNYFTTLGVNAAVGRPIVPSDSIGARGGIVVLSAPFWYRYFGGSSDVVGKKVVLRGQPMTIVGVMPADFRGTDLTNVPELWVPLAAMPLLRLPLLTSPGGVNRDMPSFSMFGRLASGARAERAQLEVGQIVAHLDHSFDLLMGFGKQTSIRVVPLSEAASGMRDRSALLRFLRVLSIVASLTFLLTCLNIGNLLVVRADEGRRERGVRLAIGASQWIVARRALLECLLLGLLGGVVAIAIAFVALQMLSAFILPGHIAMSGLGLDLNTPVLVFAIGAAFVTTGVVGLYTAFTTARVNVLDLLHGRRMVGSAGRRRRGIIAFQIAASVIIVASAVLLLRTVRTALEVNLGFHPERIAATSVVQPNEVGYANPRRQHEAVVAQLRRIPGAEGAAAATHVPLAPYSTGPLLRGPAPEDFTPGEPAVRAGLNEVSKEYFSVFDIPLIEGRTFTDEDRLPEKFRTSSERWSLPRAMVLNQSAAAVLWPGESAVGKLLHVPYFGPASLTYRVVGVVRDSRYESFRDDHVPFAYVHIPQSEGFASTLTFIVRGPRPRALLRAMERTLKEVAPGFRAVAAGSTMIPGGLTSRVLADQVDIVLQPQRFGLFLLTGFSLLTLCVSAVGIYGNVAYAVSRRRTEIGIRMALGALPGSVLRLLLTDLGVAVAAGLVVGVFGATISAKLLENLLYGVRPIDPVSLSVGAVVAIGVTLAGALGPSIRALRISPVVAMRSLT